MSWLAVNNRAAAGSMLDLFTNFTSAAIRWRSCTFVVEAYTDTPNGKAWVALDPTLKPRWFPQAGIALPRPMFDRASYLASGKTRWPRKPTWTSSAKRSRKRTRAQRFPTPPTSASSLPMSPAAFPHRSRTRPTAPRNRFPV